MESNFFFVFTHIVCLFVTVSSQKVIPLVQYDTFGYYVHVDIGTPPQRFRMVLDTGSSDTWLPSSKVNTGFCSRFNTFNCSSSLTCLGNKTFDTFTEKIGSTTLSGHYLMDDFNIGGVTDTKQTFARVNNVPVKMCLLSKYDGYLGIAQNSKFSFDEVTNEMRSRYVDMIAKNEVITFVFGINEDNKTYGEITLGETEDEPERCVKACSMSEWSVYMTGVKIADVKFKINPTMATVSTGSPLISVPTSYISKMVEQLTGKPLVYRKLSMPDMYFVDCTEADDFEDISFRFEGEWLTLTPEDYVVPTSDVNYFPNGTCYIGFAGEKSTWTFGVMFLKKYKTQFKFGVPAKICFGDTTLEDR